MCLQPGGLSRGQGGVVQPNQVSREEASRLHHIYSHILALDLHLESIQAHHGIIHALCVGGSLYICTSTSTLLVSKPLKVDLD